MTGDFKLRCGEQGMQVAVNPEPINGGMIYHLPDLGVGVFYRSDGTGALVELRATRPAHLSLVKRILLEEQER
ncbi:MAG TPA: hypothetical protein VJH22_00785 [Candidatus Nanoarchaeia archaeon]|nr:hypothetical protein [Candidatus Nanoarchaeia archaeon]